MPVEPHGPSRGSLSWHQGKGPGPEAMLTEPYGPPYGSPSRHQGTGPEASPAEPNRQHPPAHGSLSRQNYAVPAATALQPVPQQQHRPLSYTGHNRQSAGLGFQASSSADTSSGL